jgi:hypothetical protein
MMMYGTIPHWIKNKQPLENVDVMRPPLELPSGGRGELRTVPFPWAGDKGFPRYSRFGDP